jgi:hypothetical protein
MSIVILFFLIIAIYSFSYMVGGDSVLLLLVTFMVAPIISLILFAWYRNKVELTVKFSRDEIEKEGIIQLDVILQNKSIFPIPFLNIFLYKPENFELDESNELIFSLGSYQTKEISLRYTAKRRGISKIGLEKVLVKDFFDFAKCNIAKGLEKKKSIREITVIPRLFFIQLTTRILQTKSQMSSLHKSSKNNHQSNALHGEPGNELREFQPGDSLNRIHWKVSAKVDKLLIRKYDTSDVTKKEVVIDPVGLTLLEEKAFRSFFKKKDATHIRPMFDIKSELEDKLLESLISICYACIAIGKEVELWMYEKGEWNKTFIGDKREIIQLQHRLATYEFLSEPTLKYQERIPLENILAGDDSSRTSEAGEVILFTANYDLVLKESIDALVSNRYGVDTVCVVDEMMASKASGLKAANQTWLLQLEQDIVEFF